MSRPSQKALWDYMQLYIQGAVQVGKLKSATELAQVVGQAVALATLANPSWVRACYVETLANAGSTNPHGLLGNLIMEAADNIEEASRRQADPRVVQDMAEETMDRFGLVKGL